MHPFSMFFTLKLLILEVEVGQKPPLAVGKFPITVWVIIRTGVGTPTLGYYSALGFLLFPPLSIILPLVFILPTLGYYSALGFSLLPTLG